MNIKTIVGDNVRGFRHLLDFTQEKLSVRAGLHINYVSSVERGERNLGLVNMHRIALSRKEKGRGSSERLPQPEMPCVSRLEREAHAQLHRARCTGQGADAHEVRVGEARIRIAPLDVVEHVLRLGTELHFVVTEWYRTEH